jgi:hypothetical protein
VRETYFLSDGKGAVISARQFESVVIEDMYGMREMRCCCFEFGQAGRLPLQWETINETFLDTELVVIERQCYSANPSNYCQR